MADEDKSTEGKKITVRLPSIPKINPWMIATVILLVVCLVLIAQPGLFGLGVTGQATAVGGLSADQAGNKALDYINNNLIQTGEATFVSAEELTNGVYKVTTEYQGSEIDIYVTKDGKWLFVNTRPIDMTTPVTTTTTQPQELPKSDKPSVELYVMSFCPFGNKAEDTMLPVYNLLKDKIDWNIHYIVSVSGEDIRSLHGQKEVDQNEREACVLKEYGLNEWWIFATYVNENCGSDGSCWEDAAQEAGVDVSKIETCVEEEGLNLMKANAEAAESAGATGSPTLIINGVNSRTVYQYGNSEAYKEAICSAFNSPPEECEQTLSSSGSSTGGQC